MPALFRHKASPAPAEVLPSGAARSNVPTYVVDGFPMPVGVAAPAVAAPGAVPVAAPTRGRRTKAPRAAKPVSAAKTARGPRYVYSWRLWVPVKGLGYGLIVLGVLNLVHAVSRAIALGTWSSYTLLLLIGGFAGLLFTIATGALIADALPSLEVRPEGLAVTEFVRWRVLPWERILQIHSRALPGERYVLFVQYAGVPLSPEHLIYALLAGLGFKSGVFYTSDIKGFDDITRDILQARMHATPGLRVEDLLVEDVAMPVVEMTMTPLARVDALVPPVDDYNPVLGAAPAAAAATARPQLSRGGLIRMQLGLAVVPLILFWIDNLLNGGIPWLSSAAPSLIWGTATLLVFGLLELPFVALAIQALGESLLGNGDFGAALQAYPYLELPRLVGFVAVLALIVVKAPFVLIFLGWLALLGWTAYLTLLFTERLYRISRNQALVAAGVAALAQLFVLLAYTILRAPGLG